jgi:hypothetical protein
LATHIVSLLLDSGFTVVGTVRSSAKGDFLVNDLFKGRNFSYAIVEDMQAVLTLSLLLLFLLLRTHKAASSLADEVKPFVFAAHSV